MDCYQKKIVNLEYIRLNKTTLDSILFQQESEKVLTSLLVRPPLPHLCSLRVYNKQEVSAPKQAFNREHHYCHFEFL